MGILTNPHAPSGYLTTPDRLERLAADFNGVLIIDEAYADFIVPALKFDSAAIATRFPNVLVLRTLSKGYGLAGLRLGYGIGSRALVAPLLTKTKDSYNVDSIAQVLGTVALQDQEYAQRTWDKVRNERLKLAEGLSALGFLVRPSQANFVLAAPPATMPVETAQVLARSLELAGIYVRWFDEDRLRDKLRITVGTREENIALLSKMAELLTVVR